MKYFRYFSHDGNRHGFFVMAAGLYGKDPGKEFL